MVEDQPLEDRPSDQTLGPHAIENTTNGFMIDILNPFISGSIEENLTHHREDTSMDSCSATI